MKNPPDPSLPAIHDMRPALDAIATTSVVRPGNTGVPSGDHALLFVHLEGAPFHVRLGEHIDEELGVAEGGAFVVASHTLLKVQLTTPVRAVFVAFGEQLLRHAPMPFLGRAPGVRSIHSGRIARPAGIVSAAATLARDMAEDAGGFAFRSALTLAIIEGVTHDDGLIRQLDDTASDYAHARVEHAMQLIERDISAPLSLDALAQEAGLSSFHLSRSFRRITGLSIQGYIRQRRLKEACRMLSETRKPLATIAYECGFSSQSRMTTVFRQMLDTTPQAFRNQCWYRDEEAHF